MTERQKAIVRESAYNAAAEKDIVLLKFPSCIRNVRSLILTITGKIVLLAFDDASIGKQYSREFEAFCRECCASMRKRNLEPDWNFVAEIASITNHDMAGPKTMQNTFLSSFPF